MLYKGKKSVIVSSVSTFLHHIAFAFIIFPLSFFMPRKLGNGEKLEKNLEMESYVP